MIRGSRASQRQKQAELADSTEAWLYALRERVAEVEEDTQEAFRTRRQLVRLLVSGLTLGKRPEDGKTVIRIPTAPDRLANPRIRLWLV